MAMRPDRLRRKDACFACRPRQSGPIVSQFDAFLIFGGQVVENMNEVARHPVETQKGAPGFLKLIQDMMFMW